MLNSHREPHYLIFNKYETALSVLVVSTILVVSFFAISFIQQALAQGSNMTSSSSGGAMPNKTGSNMTKASSSSGGGGNASGGPNMTGIGAATGGAVKSPSAGGK
jgi:hypothetical protein